ncbi:hypothetical protein STSP2_01946 [Anaerohalosphaera lusitana]|uniref:YGGT family protein n=1 Tax=Anaerohalosphaera lusitana TaxID=1936003 RepID=A0A1U9NM17_9BACT|nr:hypothetical protein [Anaerohalosphaera lusitana]AQT68774.1 hypothetical protein STSP2_01946 [Anaerohalosphaera lusitana]
MSLIPALLIIMAHLFFVACDVILLMIILQAVYDRWQFPRLEQTIKAISPLIDYILGLLDRFLSHMINETYSRRTLLAVTAISICLLRIVISNILFL